MSASPTLAQVADRFGWTAQALSRAHVQSLLASARRIEATPPSRPLAGRHLAIATPLPGDAAVRRLRDNAVALGARVSWIPVPNVDDRTVGGVEDTCRALSRLYDALIVPEASPAWLAWLSQRCPLPVLGDLVSAASPAWLAACALAIDPSAGQEPPVLLLEDSVSEPVQAAWAAVAPAVGLQVQHVLPGPEAGRPPAWWQLQVDDQGQPRLMACKADGSARTLTAEHLQRHHAAAQEALLVDVLRS